MTRILVGMLVLLVSGCTTKEEGVRHPLLGVTCPCSVETWEAYRDGGSRGGVIRDSRGTTLKVSWDGSARPAVEGELRKPRLAYVGAEHPRNAGAQALPLGSPAETELIALFDAWIATQIPTTNVDSLLDIAENFGLSEAERARRLPDLSQTQGRALAVATISRYLKRQRAIGHAPRGPGFVGPIRRGDSNSRRPPMDALQLKEFAAQYTTAWCSQNAASVAAFFAEDGSLTINAGAPSVGRAAINAAAQSFMTAFPDMVVAMDGVTLDGDQAVYRWTLTGTNTGPDGTGQRVRISGYEEWTFGPDGLIATSMGHFDEADYERQLKVVKE